MKTKDNSEIIREALENSMSYAEYRELIDALMDGGKTTGDNHSEQMIKYTELNMARMNKWDKRFELSPDVKRLLEDLEAPETWVVLTEAWCGDAAHSVPVMAKLAEASPAIDLRVVLRDENPELMDLYLTNGGRSIPKLIRLKADDLEELATWGPRPTEAVELRKELLAANQPPAEVSKDLQLWYARNRGKAIENELAAMIAEEVEN